MPPTMRVVFGFESVESCLRDFYAHLVNCVQLPEMHMMEEEFAQLHSSLGRAIAPRTISPVSRGNELVHHGLYMDMPEWDITFLK